MWGWSGGGVCPSAMWVLGSNSSYQAAITLTHSATLLMLKWNNNSPTSYRRWEMKCHMVTCAHIGTVIITPSNICCPRLWSSCSYFYSVVYWVEEGLASNQKECVLSVLVSRLLCRDNRSSHTLLNTTCAMCYYLGCWRHPERHVLLSPFHRPGSQGFKRHKWEEAMKLMKSWVQNANSDLMFFLLDVGVSTHQCMLLNSICKTFASGGLRDPPMVHSRDEG